VRVQLPPFALEATSSKSVWPSALAFGCNSRPPSVADVFDALSHDRPYRAAWPLAKVIEEIGKAAGNQLDPNMARTFLSSCVGKSIERPAAPRTT
jgi:HD-GYP domain-containing protein (c-di-GMP phosphodiesterase class II)